MGISLDQQNAYRQRYAQMQFGWRPATEVYESSIRDALSGIEHPVVVDMGCGRGGVIEQLVDLPLRVLGFDPDLQSLEEHRLPDLPRAVAAADDLPLPDACADLVISAWVLEHLTAPENVFASVARVLKPGGHFIFMTPNKNSLTGRLNLALMPLQKTLVPLLYQREEADTFPVVYRANTPSTLHSLAQTTGMTVTELHCIHDPTYFAFNDLFFRASVLLTRLMTADMGVHLVGVCRK